MVLINNCCKIDSYAVYKQHFEQRKYLEVIFETKFRIVLSK